jgi:hypothetical protein
VVIGETAIIGNDVTLYHSVTLGGRRHKLEPDYQFMIRVRLKSGVCQPRQRLTSTNWRTATVRQMFSNSVHPIDVEHRIRRFSLQKTVSTE